MAPSAKADAKAASADKAAEKAALAALGITPALKKAMVLDALTCTTCSATKLGPLVCGQTSSCKASQKPPGNYDATNELLAAAKGRVMQDKEANKKANAEGQSKVTAQRAKNKEERIDEQNDLTVTHQQGTGDDLLVLAEFPAGGKLGFTIEMNAVTEVKAATEAAAQGVQRGWVIEQINGDFVEPNKNAILKAASAAVKAAQGPLRIGFRTPMSAGFHCCSACHKFVGADEFGEGQVESKGPGKQMCQGCEDFNDMGGGDW